MLVLGDNNFMHDTLSGISEYLITNSDIYGLSDLANTLPDCKLFDSIRLKGEAKARDEFAEYYVEDNKLKIFCVDILFK